VQNNGVLARFNRAKRSKRKRIIDIRGIPSHACVCGSRVFKVKCMFEDNDIALWYIDAECDMCGALVTVPTPVDNL